MHGTRSSTHDAAGSRRPSRRIRAESTSGARRATLSPSGECAGHPVIRIVRFADEPGGFAVATTDGKLAQAMGRALAKAYAAKVTHPRATADEGGLVRVRWTRE